MALNNVATAVDFSGFNLIPSMWEYSMSTQKFDPGASRYQSDYCHRVSSWGEHDVDDEVIKSTLRNTGTLVVENGLSQHFP